ncbi:hypothetical protein EUTSA_v10011891mg [Eutrema salsugineum]|uniref:Uncharacterized protein n=1 Tax=Eutrema salsugineum TaxID=72664 RepID=V4MI64_EUTSA|nr:hypothetical protein EUTSA_v10011891mg [Eutrema salsugineum]
MVQYQRLIIHHGRKEERFRDSFSRESEALSPYEPSTAPLCSDNSTGTICCDRTGLRSDICVMKGDVRTNSAYSSVFLFTSTKNNTRKWETSVIVFHSN